MSKEQVKKEILDELSTGIFAMRRKKAVIMFPNMNGIRVLSIEEYVEWVIEKVYLENKNEQN